ncbi:bifunctional DNA primase/polymerase [Streptomyces radiopugnans]|nr:bifunctional DNA primase/polymerase [Streptomyces radiopugnans]
MQMMTRRGVQWLSAAADDPGACRAAWLDDPRRPYALPAYRLFDVVVLDQRIGLETFDQLDRRGMPLGPVSTDWAAKQVGFFLPPKSRSRFTRIVAGESSNPPEYRYLDDGSVIVVPGPMPLSGDRYTWLRAPMREPGPSPARLAALAAMFVAASELLARADRYGEEHAYADGAGQETARAR